MNRSRPLLCVGILVWTVAQATGCSSGGTTPAYDLGSVDTENVDGWVRYDGVVQDWGMVPDIYPTPVDKSVTPHDSTEETDAGLCGNKKVDSPAETCDKAIDPGKEGACPTAADCDDGNPCTNDSLVGSAAACTAECVHAPMSNCCGNGAVEGAEECDDGNVVDQDGCTNGCKLPGGHLLITEVAVSPGDAEFVEIYNPANSTVALDNIYLADRTDYFMLTVADGLSGPTGTAYDFVAGFPPGASIGPGAYVVISIQDALTFQTTFGVAPNYEMKSLDPVVPDMVPVSDKAIGSVAGLTDAGELVILFSWDGIADRVEDIDYVVWQGASTTAVSKTSICVDGIDADTADSCYLPDTAVTAQSFLSPPNSGGSLHRCDYLEGSETKSGGNGVTGHDETSEPMGATAGTWKRNPSTVLNRTPGGPAPAGFCPP